jgi:hypothetical protein
MPFIAFDLAAMEDAAPAARDGGISEEKMAIGAFEACGHGVGRRSDHVSPSPHLAGFLWTGDADRVAAGLSTFGFLEQDGVQLRCAAQTGTAS